MVAPSTRWSVYAGSALFLAGAVVVAPLGIIAETLFTVLGLPTGDTILLLPGSAAVLGGVVWWAVVERRAADDYPSGGAAGILTALLTVGFWTLLVAVVYGPGVVLVDETRLVIGVVLAVTTPAGAAVLLAVMYARRRIHNDPAGGSEATVE